MRRAWSLGHGMCVWVYRRYARTLYDAYPVSFVNVVARDSGLCLGLRGEWKVRTYSLDCGGMHILSTTEITIHKLSTTQALVTGYGRCARVHIRVRS